MRSLRFVGLEVRMSLSTAINIVAGKSLNRDQRQRNNMYLATSCVPGRVDSDEPPQLEQREDDEDCSQRQQTLQRNCPTEAAERS